MGVFWDHPRGHIKAIAETCGLRALQFHGDEKPEDVAGYDLPVIKTIKLPPATTIEGLPEFKVSERIRAAQYHQVAAAVLMDTDARWSEGEARSPLDWRITRGWLEMSRLPMILSGGLTPDNVARAISVAQPFAVDVVSGVEARPGKKDPDKVRRFIAEAKRA